MAYWLVKSEPDAFSWAQQMERGVEPWTGVRNHSAKLNLAAMRLGDRALFYHSNIGKEVVGIVEVVREAYPDPTAESGGWVCVDMRADPALAELALLRQSRLSVSPVSKAHWRRILALGGVMG